MLRFKNLSVTISPWTNFLRKAGLCENTILTNSHQGRNLTFYTKKSPYFRGVDRGFCSQLRNEDLLEATDEFNDSKENVVDTEKVFEEIANGDPAILNKLKLLEFEVAVLREEECRVPENMKMAFWTELLGIHSVTKRRKYLAFLRLNELRKMNEIKKSEGKREFWLKRKEELGFHYYGLSGHSLFMRVYDKDVNNLLNLKVQRSSFDIVFDCSYQDYMSDLNVKACAKQLFYCYNDARMKMSPGCVKLFNFNKSDSLGRILPNYVKNVYENHGDNIHSDSFLKFYPKEKVIYLTPHTREVLTEFNPDNIYIIGAFVDRGTGEKVSLAKAKELKLKMAKFPIDEYLQWKKGIKSLPLNIVVNVLLDMVYYSDWKKAFKNLPTRCFNN